MVFRDIGAAVRGDGAEPIRCSTRWRATARPRHNAFTMDLQVAESGRSFLGGRWIGDVSAVLLIAVRTWRLIFHPGRHS